MHVEFIPYNDTDTFQIYISDALLEALDNDSLFLQSLSCGKYVQVTPNKAVQSKS